MFWVTVAVLWLVGAAIPWNKHTFRQRLAQPLSPLVGAFVVAAAVPIVGVGLLIVGLLIDPFF